MNRHQTYRQKPLQIPADHIRADTCDTRRFMNPHLGIWDEPATDSGYWHVSPNGEKAHLTTIVHCSLYIVHCQSYTFSAKERDSETGLSYFGSRYYSSDLSIWLSVDPMSDDYPYQSNYVYCSNNPLMIVDPNGMFETRAEAQKYRKEHHTGGSIHKRSKHDNYSGNYSIVNRRTNTSYTKPQYQEESSVPTSGMGDDGVVTSAVISSKSLNSDANYTISSSEITSLPSNTNIMSSTATACLLLASDDWTGFGIADDIFIPVVIVAGTAAYGGVVLFAHVRKKQSTGKSKRDRHDRQYNQGVKHRPNNPNRRKGANERKK